MWEKAIGKFPFGFEIEQIKQQDRNHKDVFVLGKYASAIHGKFISNKIRTINALAISSEPCIFWDGHDAEEKIEQINKIIPSEIGRFELPNNDFNGPSGKALDKYYLDPLGLKRNDVWLCDLIPQFLINKSKKPGTQFSAQILINNYLKEINMTEFQSDIPKVPKNIDALRILEIKNELIESGANTIVLLGENTLEWFIAKVSDFNIIKLREIKPYGKPFDIKINGIEKTFKVYALAHMHHIEKPIGPGKEWAERHFDWIKNIK